VALNTPNPGYGWYATNADFVFACLALVNMKDPMAITVESAANVPTDLYRDPYDSINNLTFKTTHYGNI